MTNLPTIYYSNGHFLVYTKEEALLLREKRIIGQLIGCCPKNAHQIATSNFPYLLNHYSVFILLSNKLAQFKKFKHKQNNSIEENKIKFNDEISQLKSVAETEFVNKRLEELKKRNIEPNPKRIGKFDVDKLKLTIPDTPKVDYTSFELITMEEIDVKNQLDVQEDKLAVYRDLYDKGFYISFGMKFGSDFLAYFGDPVRYHAQYAIRVFSTESDQISLKEVDYNELNALNRLCHTANKIVILATVFKDINNFTNIKYWTMKSREILDNKSDCKIFNLIDSLSSQKQLSPDDEQVNKCLKL